MLSPVLMFQEEESIVTSNWSGTSDTPLPLVDTGTAHATQSIECADQCSECVMVDASR